MITKLLSFARPLLVLLALASAWACSGPTAMAPQAATAPEPTPRHQEIDHLWSEIAAWRGQAGLSPGTVTTQAAGSDVEIVEEAADAGRPDSPARSSGGPDPERIGAQVRGPEVECPVEVEPSSRCGDACTLGSSICENAGRICRLASELAGDAWAAGKCADAAAVCREATERCCACRDDA